MDEISADNCFDASQLFDQDSALNSSSTTSTTASRVASHIKYNTHRDTSYVNPQSILPILDSHRNGWISSFGISTGMIYILPYYLLRLDPQS